MELKDHRRKIIFTGGVRESWHLRSPLCVPSTRESTVDVCAHLRWQPSGGALLLSHFTDEATESPVGGQARPAWQQSPQATKCLRITGKW